MKQISLLAFTLVFGLASFAQRHRTVSTYGSTPTVQFGLKGGLNLADLEDSNNPVTDLRVGYHAGLLAHIHINHDLALQPEVLYSAQGAKYNYSNKRGTTQIYYVNIPILLQYMFSNGFRLETGPQLGFLANAKFQYTNGAEANIKNTYKSTDVSWAFGAGYKSYSGLGIDVRYNLGLTNVSFTGNTIKNKVWQLGLFYQFQD